MPKVYTIYISVIMKRLAVINVHKCVCYVLDLCAIYIDIYKEEAVEGCFFNTIQMTSTWIAKTPRKRREEIGSEERND